MVSGVVEVVVPVGGPADGSLVFEVPGVWEDAVREVGAACAYGPGFKRGAVEAVLSLRRSLGAGHVEGAAYFLAGGLTFVRSELALDTFDDVLRRADEFVAMTKGE